MCLDRLVCLEYNIIVFIMSTLEIVVIIWEHNCIIIVQSWQQHMVNIYTHEIVKITTVLWVTNTLSW